MRAPALPVPPWQVVSCSQFEAHAGRGSRRAPYDNIFTSAGITLKAIAAALPELPEEGGPGDGEYDLAHIQDGCVLDACVGLFVRGWVWRGLDGDYDLARIQDVWVGVWVGVLVAGWDWGAREGVWEEGVGGK